MRLSFVPRRKPQPIYQRVIDRVTGAEPKEQAKTLAAMRTAFGVTHMIAPARSGGSWLGHHTVASPRIQLLLRMFGAREVALGAGVLLALRHDAPVRGWLEGGVVCDATDALAALIAFRHLPLATRLIVPASAATAAYVGIRLTRELD